MGWLLSSEALAISEAWHPERPPFSAPRLPRRRADILAAPRRRPRERPHRPSGRRRRGHWSDRRPSAVPCATGATLADFLALQLAHGPPLLAAAVREVLTGTARPVSQPRASPTRRARRFVAGDPVMTEWLELDLHEACRMLRGVGPVLNCPSPSWRAMGHLAVVTGSSFEPSGMPSGRVGRDGRGWFLAHPQGRLYLRWRWLPRAWLLALRRRGAPATGIIAIETAAGLLPAGGAPDL